MANEIRLRANNISGTISDNPLLIGATTINSPGFVDLPTVGATNHLILILDPLEVNGQAEIVQVTAHSAASSVVTVIRGFETTTPRQHGLGTTWFHGPVHSDYEEILTSGTRPVVPYTGESIFETDTARAQRYSGTAWAQDGLYFDPPACRVFNVGAQTIPDITITTVTFDSERYDTDGMHSTSVNTGRITFNTAGLYLVVGNVTFGGSDYSSGALGIRLNNTTNIAQTSTNGFTDGTFNEMELNVATVYKFAVNDFIELKTWQNNTANVARSLIFSAYSPEFMATWIGRGN